VLDKSEVTPSTVDDTGHWGALCSKAGYPSLESAGFQGVQLLLISSTLGTTAQKILQFQEHLGRVEGGVHQTLPQYVVALLQRRHRLL
jgi:hypothetical protein